MIITIGGSIASGKTTLAKKISKKFNLKHISAGIVMREMAKEEGISLIELSKYMEEHPEIDKEIDKRQKKLAESGDCVVDGRISAYFIESDLKIWLTAPLDVRAERVIARDKLKNINEAREKIKERESSEKKRYRDFYDIDLDNMEVYDLIINTEKFGVDGMCEIAYAAIEKLNIKHYQ